MMVLYSSPQHTIELSEVDNLGKVKLYEKVSKLCEGGLGQQSGIQKPGNAYYIRFIVPLRSLNSKPLHSSRRDNNLNKKQNP